MEPQAGDGTATQDLPFFEDFLNERKAKRSDWAASHHEICVAAGVSYNSQVVTRLEKYGLKTYMVVSTTGNGTRPITVANKQEIVAAKKKWDAAESYTAPVVANGHVQAATPDLSRLPANLALLGREDAESLKQALWAQKSSSDVLAKSVNGLTDSVNALNQTVKQQTTEMKRIFDGEKK